jgi:hypothetical protein
MSRTCQPVVSLTADPFFVAMPDCRHRSRQWNDSGTLQCCRVLTCLGTTCCDCEAGQSFSGRKRVTMPDALVAGGLPIAGIFVFFPKDYRVEVGIVLCKYASKKTLNSKLLLDSSSHVSKGYGKC